MRALIIEDDESLARATQIILARNEIDSHWTATGEEGIEQARAQTHDIVILDLNVPDISGIEVLKRIRAEKCTTPVLVLSGYSSVADKVRALDMGADDYICKPFNATELIARIEAITRRSRELPNAVLTIGALRIDLRRKVVRVGQRDINLTPREFDVVEALAKRPGAIISKENLMLILYQGMSNVHMKIIDVYICKIRKKIEQATNGGDYIGTVRGEGYFLAWRNSFAIAPPLLNENDALALAS